MAKKSFTNNPALNFISSAQPQQEKQPEVKQKEVKAKPAKTATKPTKEKPAAKPEAEKITKSEQPIQTLFDIQVKPVERKSERLQLLVRPSILDKLKMVAKTKNTSVNELANVIFETFLK